MSACGQCATSSFDYHVISQTPRQHMRFNVTATWHQPRHQVAASSTTSRRRSPPFSTTASGSHHRPIAEKLKKNPFLEKTSKNLNRSTKTPKITKKENMCWKGLNKIFLSIPNLHQKTDTKNTEKKKIIFVFSLFFFFKKPTDAQRAPYWL